jgi:hypothetical protein
MTKKVKLVIKVGMICTLPFWIIPMVIWIMIKDSWDEISQRVDKRYR